MTKSVSISPGQQPTSNIPKWTTSAVLGLYEWPFMDIVYRAQEIHRNHFEPNAVQLSSLLSIKTGACPEDCAYCPQSAHYKTDVVVEKLLSTDTIINAAREAKCHGASRFCMGAAWREPKDKDLEEVIKAIEGVKALGLETCATLGMLNREQAERLKEAGLDYYNHNLDTSEEFYDSIVTTRTYQDRLDTLDHVQACGLKVCCGGIIGMGESRKDRAAMIATLATLPTPPQSVPINMLVQTRGTPLDGVEKPDSFEFIRTIAVARITMPSSYVRLSAGRHDMNDEMQALCFLAGANSIFYGDKLLTTGNASVEHDKDLLHRLGMTVEDPPGTQ